MGIDTTVTVIAAAKIMSDPRANLGLSLGTAMFMIKTFPVALLARFQTLGRSRWSRRRKSEMISGAANELTAIAIAAEIRTIITAFTIETS